MNLTIREGRLDEVEKLVALRCAMFEAMGTDAQAIERVAEASRRYFAEEMPTGRFRVWVSIDDTGEPIASIGLVVHSVPPGPSNAVGKVGYIMNLVTLPDRRRQGIAHALLTHVLEVLRAEGVPIATLHASSDGRALYEELGFELRDEVPEMVLRL